MNNLKILIIDDDADYCFYLETLLQKRNYDILSVNDGQTALNFLRESAYDLTLIDVKLGTENGLELLTKIKNINSETVNIIMTAHGSIKSAVEAIKLGAYDYLSKPITEDNLFVTIDKAFETLNLKKEKQKAEEEARFLSHIVEQVTDAISVVTLEPLSITYVNKAFEELYGYKADELIGKTPFVLNAVLTPFDNIDKYKEIVSSGETKIEQKRQLKKDGNVFICECKVSPKFDKDGNIDSIIIVHRNITERIEAERELNENRKMLNEAQKIAQIGSWEIDITLNKVKCSEQFFRLYGLEPDDDGSGFKQFMEYVHPEDKEFVVNVHDDAVSGKTYPTSFNYKIIRKDGKLRYFHIDSVEEHNSEGNIIKIRGFIQDITEKHELEKSIQNSLKEKEAILNALPDTIVILNKETVIEFIKPDESEEAYIFTEDKLGKKLEYVNIPKHFLKPSMKLIQEVIKTGKTQNAEYIIEHKGIKNFYDARISPLSSSQVIVSIRNFSEMKKMEEELRESHQNANAILNSTEDSVLLIEIDGKILLANEGAAKRVNVPHNKLIGKNAFDLIPKEVAAFRKKQFEKVRKTKKFVRFEDYRNGMNIINNVYPVFDKNGDVYRVAVFASDITELRQMEQALKQSEKKFEETLKNIKLISLILDVKGNITFCNDFFLELTGYSRDEIMYNRYFDTFLDEDIRDYVKTTYYSMIAKKQVNVHNENEIMTKSGEKRYILWTVTTLYDIHHNITGVACIGNDITDYRNAVREVELSEERFRYLYETSLVGIYNARLEDGKFLGMNQTCAEILGYEIEEIVNEIKTFDFYFSQKRRLKFLEQIKKDRFVKDFEVELIRKDGKRITVLINAFIYPKENTIEGTLIDITKLKDTERELFTSKERYRNLFNSIKDAIFVFKLDKSFSPDKIIEVNDFACRMYNKTREEFLTITPSFFNIEEELQELEKLKDEFIQKKSITFETTHRVEGKNPMIVEVTSHLIEVDNEPAVLSINKDITKRKKNELALKNRYRYEKALSDASQSLLLSGGDIYVVLKKVLRYSLIAAQSCRVYIYENRRDPVEGLIAKEILEVCNKGVELTINNPSVNRIAYKKTHPRWLKLLPKNKIISNQIDELPDSEKEFFEKIDVQSLLIIPIWIDDEWYGFLGFEDVNFKRKWHEEDIILLRTISQMIGVFIGSHRSDEALKMSEARMRLIVENLPFLVNAIDEKGNIIMWNKECERVTGFSSNEVLFNKDIFETLYPGNGNGSSLDFLFYKNLKDYEIEIGCKDGSKRIVSWTNISKRYPITGWASWAVGEDITERKRAEQNLRTSEEKYRTLAETAKDIIFISDYQGKITYINKAGKRASTVKLEGKPILEIFKIVPEKHHEKLNKYFADRMNGIDEIRTYEIEYIDKHGRHVPIEINSSVIEEGGQQKGILVIARDLTERKQSEEVLLQSSKLAAIGEMAAGMAHEVYQPISAIMLFAQGLEELSVKEKFSSKRFSDDLKLISELANKTTEIINEIRSFARPAPKEYKDVNIHEVIYDALKIVRKQFQTDGIDLKLNFDDSLPMIKGNANQLQQVVLNLLNNARDSFNDVEDKNISLFTEQLKENKIKLIVKDNGSGMSQDTVDKLFIPFFTTKERSKGMGLGLSISYRIIKEHNGEIHVKSEENVGTEFAIILPVFS